MRKAKGVRGILILLILIFMMVGYYFYLANRNTPIEEDNVQLTRVQEVLTRNIALNYPASPKEVVKYYCEITQCFYSGEASAKEQEQLAQRHLELLDKELVSFQSPEDYIHNLGNEIQNYRKQNLVVSSYKVANSTDVAYFNKNGYECAGLLATYTLRQGTSLKATEELFILRKDKEGRWKILGWTVANDEIKRKIQGIEG